ncbi:hypothetical protein A9Z06_09040 [Rhizobium sp. YK2]|nr:hypothetical protein A9Z06_09040 [Rhizobium sp. YK2]
MKVAMVCAGFTGGEADRLRKSMATFKFTGGVSKFKDKLVSGMVRNGYTPEFAEKTFSQLEGWDTIKFRFIQEMPTRIRRLGFLQNNLISVALAVLVYY